MAHECSICYDAINATTGVATLSCSHSFHICCIAGWFAKLEKGTCPCCRKEMSALEDLPQATEADDESDDDDDDEDDDDSVDEVEFSRADLDAFLRARGGHGLTDAMAAEVCPEFGTFMGTELNALVVGNGARPLTREEWIALLQQQDEDEEEDEDNDEIAAAVATVWNELASYDEPPRAWLMADGSWTSTVLNPEEATNVAVVASPAAAPSVASSAATKVQAVWRGFKGRLAMLA
jgi:hypothetical protein